MRTKIFAYSLMLFLAVGFLAVNDTSAQGCNQSSRSFPYNSLNKQDKSRSCSDSYKSQRDNYTFRNQTSCKETGNRDCNYRKEKKSTCSQNYRPSHSQDRPNRVNENRNEDRDRQDGRNEDNQSNVDASQMENKVLNLINQQREEYGLEPLSLDSSVSQIAREHSENMASGQVAFGHDGFNQRASQIGGRGVAENVAYNNSQDPAQTAVSGWMNSTGHKENILGEYTETGIGIAEKNGQYYFTQIFVR